MTAYVVCGTQAELGKQNHVIVMKMSEMNKTSGDDDCKSFLKSFALQKRD